MDLEVTEWDVRDGEVVEVVRPLEFLESEDANIGILVELLQDAAGDGSSSIAVLRVFCASSDGINPRKCPTPADGSRTRPPMKPSRRTASNIALTTAGEV